MSQITIKRMWKGGPLREWSETRPTHAWGIPYATGGFARQYVCDSCRTAVVGIYPCSVAWLCSGCRARLKKSQDRLEAPVGRNLGVAVGN